MKQRANFIRNGILSILLIAAISVNAQTSQSACDIYVEVATMESVVSKAADQPHRMSPIETTVAKNKDLGSSLINRNLEIFPGKQYGFQIVHPRLRSLMNGRSQSWLAKNVNRK